MLAATWLERERSLELLALESGGDCDKQDPGSCGVNILAGEPDTKEAMNSMRRIIS